MIFKNGNTTYTRESWSRGCVWICNVSWSGCWGWCCRKSFSGRRLKGKNVSCSASTSDSAKKGRIGVIFKTN
jgi:hypothetical protein